MISRDVPVLLHPGAGRAPGSGPGTSSPLLLLAGIRASQDLLMGREVYLEGAIGELNRAQTVRNPGSSPRCRDLGLTQNRLASAVPIIV